MAAPQVIRESVRQLLSALMPARFLVDDTFNLTSRRVFVLPGQILEGAVRRGQIVRTPSGLDAPVDAIDFVLLSATEGLEKPALTFKYRDETELARWEALNLRGQTLELEDPEEPIEDQIAPE